jgi:nucleotide-binding universal stress UspA family protein
MQEKPIFKKILVPTDGSFPSLIAQELAASIAKKLSSNVTVLYVVSHEFMVPQVGEFYPEMDISVAVGTTQEGTTLPRRAPGLPSPRAQALIRDITNWYHEKGDEIIAKAVALFKEEGIPVEQKIVEHADPAETIIKEAEKGNFDLIVLGYSGEEEPEPHLGSVAEKVSHHAKAPVLIAHNKKQISKMLVPVDGSENSMKALQHAALLAKKVNAQITLLYVQESGLFKLRPEATKEIGTRILSNAASLVKGIKLDQRLESGDPAKIINQTADKGDYDVIVLGSRGHGALGRFLLGSVSNHVVHYAKRSVLLLK